MQISNKRRKIKYDESLNMALRYVVEVFRINKIKIKLTD